MNTYAVYNAPINGLPQYGWVDGGGWGASGNPGEI